MIDGGVLIVPKVKEVIERAVLAYFIVGNVGQVSVDCVIEYRHIGQRGYAWGRLSGNVGSRMRILERRRTWNSCDYSIAPKPTVVREHGCHHVAGPESMWRRGCYRYDLGNALSLRDRNSCKRRVARLIGWRTEADP